MRKSVLSHQTEALFDCAPKCDCHCISTHARGRFNEVDGEQLRIRTEPGRRIRSINVMRAKEMYAAKCLKVYRDVGVLMKLSLQGQASIEHIRGSETRS